MPDEKGQTRRERNIAFGVEDETPEIDIPSEGWELWQWYWTISSRLRRVVDGICEPIRPSEFLAWCEASDTIIRAPEYAILCAMDDAFCSEMNSEINDFRQRQEEQRKREAEAAKRR
jgi:hypothetical protein